MIADSMQWKLSGLDLAEQCMLGMELTAKRTASG